MALVATRLPVKLVLTMASSPADISLFSRGPSAADQSPIPGGKAGGHTHTHPVPRNLPSQQQQSPGNFPGPAWSKQTCFIPLTAA